MSVYFLDLKYGQILDCSYALETGMAHEQLDFDKNRYSVGDEVELLLELPKWEWKAIKENCTDKQVAHLSTVCIFFRLNSYLFVSVTCFLIAGEQLVIFSHIAQVCTSSQYLWATRIFSNGSAWVLFRRG